MLIVPTQANPNQAFSVTLAGQQCQIALRQSDYGLFMDLQSNGTSIVSGVLCEDLNPLVRAMYTGFIGELEFFDATGQGTDPVYTGLGTRYLLIYLEAADLAAG